MYSYSSKVEGESKNKYSINIAMQQIAEDIAIWTA